MNNYFKFIILFTCILVSACNSQSPRDLVEHQTELRISNSATIVKFENYEDNFRGYIFRNIQLSVPDSVLPNLITQCINNGYKPLPIKVEGYGLEEYSKAGDSGYYKLNILSPDSSDYELSLLIVNRHTIYAFKTID